MMNWKYGQRAELARRAQISPQYLHDLLTARKRATPERALNLEQAAKSMGLPLSRLDFLYPSESLSPLIG